MGGWKGRVGLKDVHFVISYIIHENQVMFYLLQTIFAYVLWNTLQTPSSSSSSPWYLHPCLLLILTRMASSSVQCREEQLPKCESTFYATPPLHLVAGLFHSTSTTLVALIPLFGLALWFPSLLKGSLEARSRATVRAVQLVLLCLALYWTCDHVESSHDSTVVVARVGAWLIQVLPGKVWFARVSFTVGIVSFLNSCLWARDDRNSFLMGIYMLVVSAQTPSGIWMLSLCLWKAVILARWASSRGPTLVTGNAIVCVCGCAGGNGGRVVMRNGVGGGVN